MTIYTVKRGDTLYSIAKKHATTVAMLANDNGISKDDILTVGQDLVIRKPELTYVVRSRDTLGGIAAMFGLTSKTLFRNNPFLMGNENTKLLPGEEFVIQGEKTTQGQISVTGYAYPFIAEGNLRAVLPFLTYLGVFSYGIQEEDASLVGIDDGKMLKMAEAYDVIPIMMLTTVNSTGTFRSETAVKVLSDADFQKKLIDNVRNAVKEKGYGGVEVDFEYVPPQYAEEYAGFIDELRSALAVYGKVVFADLAPKTSSNQPGLLYEAHDYGLMGDAADRLLLMTYEWGYTYGPPMAVAPLPNVRRVVEYATTEIPSFKLRLGIPNYGYNWTLPFIKGKSKAKSLSHQEALYLAKEKHAEIHFDEKARAPYFIYYDKNNGETMEHIVWFENARSLYEKLLLVSEYKLNGTGIWTVMKPFVPFWTLLATLFQIDNE